MSLSVPKHIFWNHCWRPLASGVPDLLTCPATWGTGLWCKEVRTWPPAVPFLVAVQAHLWGFCDHGGSFLPLSLWEKTFPFLFSPCWACWGWRAGVKVLPCSSLCPLVPLVGGGAAEVGSQMTVIKVKAKALVGSPGDSVEPQEHFLLLG